MFFLLIEVTSFCCKTFKQCRKTQWREWETPHNSSPQKSVLLDVYCGGLEILRVTYIICVSPPRFHVRILPVSLVHTHTVYIVCFAP